MVAQPGHDFGEDCPAWEKGTPKISPTKFSKKTTPTKTNKRPISEKHSTDKNPVESSGCGVAKFTPLHWPYYIGAKWSERSA
jgi:hypothetical protein